MRPDILPGTIQWFSSSAAEVSAPRTAGRLKGLLNSIVSSRLAIAGWSRLAPTISPRRMNIAAESVPTGLSSPTRGVSSKKISTSLNTLILLHNPMIPHVIVLEPGLVIYKIYNGYWFFGRPTHGRSPPGPTRRYQEMPAGLGHHNARTQSGVAARPQGTLLSVRQNVRPNSR